MKINITKTKEKMLVKDVPNNHAFTLKCDKNKTVYIKISPNGGTNSPIYINTRFNYYIMLSNRQITEMEIDELFTIIKIDIEPV